MLHSHDSLAKDCLYYDKKRCMNRGIKLDENDSPCFLCNRYQYFEKGADIPNSEELLERFESVMGGAVYVTTGG